MPAAVSTPQRETILSAALEVLVTRGAAGLTVRNVAEAAGCSTTGVYTYFGGKSGLVDAIFVDGFERFAEELRRGGAVTDLAGFRRMGQRYRRFALDHPTQYLVMFARAVPDHQPSDEAIEVSAASFELLVSAIAGAMPGIDDIDAFAYHVWATIHGYVMLELAGMDPHCSGDTSESYEHGLDLLVAEYRT